MKVSIITVVFNNKKSIKDAILSVLNQDYPLIEYIIIDGMSSDGTIEVINEFKNKVSKFISEKDNGIYDAMNKGIKNATGEIIGLLNSDDVYENNQAISKIVESFKINNTDSVFGDIVYINAFNKKILRSWRPGKFVKGSFKKGWHLPHPAFFVKKKIFERYGLFDPKLDVSADFELSLRFLERYNISSYYIPETIVRMRVGGKSRSSIKNIITGNINALKAFKINNIKVSMLYPFYRLIPKLLEYFKKNKI
jgi:glycosyltransferase involved in cell wall biosynthesis